MDVTLGYPAKGPKSGRKHIHEAQGGVVNGKLYVFGGFINGFRFMNKKVHEFNPATNQWTMEGEMPVDFAGITHCANAVDEKTATVFLIGGLALKQGEQWPKGAYATKDTLAYNTIKKTWSRLPDLPEARGAGAAVVLGRKLHFFNGASFDGAHGGFTEDHTTHWAMDLSKSNPSWTRLAGNSLGRNHLGGVVWDGKIFAIGGQFLEEEGCTNQKLVEVYNPKTNKWSRKADLPFGTGHISPSTHSAKHGIVVVGGITDKARGCKPPGTKRSQVLFYNPAADSWTDLYSQYKGASLVSGIVNDVLYMQNGNGLEKIRLNWERGGTSSNVEDGDDTASIGIDSSDSGVDGGNVAMYTTLAAMVVIAMMVGVFVLGRRVQRLELALTTISFSTTSSEAAGLPLVSLPPFAVNEHQRDEQDSHAKTEEGRLAAANARKRTSLHIEAPDDHDDEGPIMLLVDNAATAPAQETTSRTVTV